MLSGGARNDTLHGGNVPPPDRRLRRQRADLAWVEAALADWSSGDLVGALVELGAITDEGDKDGLTGGKGLDELIGGIADKLKASSLPHSNVANLS